MSFYLTLPSNSSMNYFPDNTLAQYTTKLVRPVQLEGDWEVALVEILYPYSFDNIPKFSAIIMGEKSKRILPVPDGQYRSIDHLVKVLNSNSFLSGFGSFAYDPVTGHTRFTYKDAKAVENMSDGTVFYKTSEDTNVEELKIHLTPELNSILGEIDFSCDDSCISILPSDLDYCVPDQMFIYSDIVENQFVGHTSAPLLRTVAITKGEKNIQKIFNSPHYVRVQRRHFDTIDVDIRTRTGDKMPFGQGLVTCKLHFRKV